MSVEFHAGVTELWYSNGRRSFLYVIIFDVFLIFDLREGFSIISMRRNARNPQFYSCCAIVFTPIVS